MSMNSEEKAQFDAERLTGIGGSDAAVIAGEMPGKWGSEMTLYRKKMGLAVEEEMTPEMEWGVRNESTVREKFDEVIADRSGGSLRVDTTQLFYRHPEHECLLAHVDGIISNGKPQAVLEIKTAGAFMAKNFGDEWTDQVPPQYLIQCQHYMSVLQLPETYLALLIGGNDFRIFHILRNQKLIDDLVDLEVSWWNNYIVPQTPPPIDGSEASTKALKEMYPEDDGGEMVATEDMYPHIHMLKEQKSVKAGAEKLIMEARNHILKDMGKNSVLTGPDFRFTYKKSKDGEKTDWKKVAIKAGASEDLIVDHTIVKPGSRRFLTKFDKE